MDDAAAIEKCLNGETDAFRHLVEGYQKQAVAHAVAILGNREDALDAVQEAFIDAFRSLKNFDRTRKFYPWFYVLLRHRCFKMTAKRRDTESIEETEILAAPNDSPVEESFALERALLTLEKEGREIITLKYLDGLYYCDLRIYFCGISFFALLGRRESKKSTSLTCENIGSFRLTYPAAIPRMLSKKKNIILSGTYKQNCKFACRTFFLFIFEGEVKL